MTTLATEPEVTTWTCGSSFCDNELDSPQGRCGSGYCNGCYQRWWRAGMPEDGPAPPVHPQPPVRGSRETMERLERFAELRDRGLTLPACAAAMGITESVAGHLSGMLLRQQREQALGTEAEQAIAAITDWPEAAPDDPGADHWTGRAACRGADPGLFFAPEGRGMESEIERRVREAKAKHLCVGCPVRTDCLMYALDRPEKYGTWGGLNEDKRASERRRRQKRRAAAAQKENAA